MTFPDSAVLSNAERTRLDAPSWDHHECCPQHPYNDVADDVEPCECRELRAGDASDAAEHRADARRES